MSNEGGDWNEGVRAGARRLLARGAGDRTRAARRLDAAIADLHLPDADRIDDRLRATVRATIERECNAIERDLRHYAGRLLVSRGAPELALALSGEPMLVHDALAASGVLRDPALMHEWFARTAEALLAEQLPGNLDPDAPAPALLGRLATDHDGVVARAVAAYQTAEAHRRAALSGSEVSEGLAAEYQHQLVWAAAAMLRKQLAVSAGRDLAALDAALAEAAARALAAYDESGRLESTAMELCRALALAPEKRAELLAEALGGRHLALFTALLADALGTGYAVIRDFVIDPAGDQLWLALRSVALDRPNVARIGLALAEAEPRRDVEAFADQIDAIMAISPEDARLALADACLHPDLRDALAAIGR